MVREAVKRTMRFHKVCRAVSGKFRGCLVLKTRIDDSIVINEPGQVYKIKTKSSRCTNKVLRAI